jgi:hypothetical protein
MTGNEGGPSCSTVRLPIPACKDGSFLFSQNFPSRFLSESQVPYN